MADNIWTDGAATGLWNNTGNWSLGWIPTAGDAAVLDGSQVADCTVDVAIACDEIRTDSGYTGTLDFSTYDITTDDSGGGSGDMLYNAGTILAGTGTTHDCDGDFYNSSATAWTRGTSKVILRGTGKTLSTRYADRSFYEIDVYGTYTVAGGYPGGYSYGMLTIKSGGTFTNNYRWSQFGGLTIESGGEVVVGNGSADFMTCGNDVWNKAGGTVSGLGFISFSSGGEILEQAGTWTVSETRMVRGGYRMAGGTYSGDTFVFEQAWLDGNMYFRLGYLTPAVIFDCDVFIDADRTGTATFDLDYYDCDVEFNGDLTIADSVGTLVFTPSTTYPITFGGTGTFTDTTAAGIDLGDVIVNATSLTLATDLTAGDFTLTAGTLDPAGYDITASGDMDWASGSVISDPVGSTILVGGNFTANGQDLSTASGAWTLTITSGTAVASGTGLVANCDASAGTEITAAAGPWTDSGGNDNWNFGAVIPIFAHHYHQLTG